MDPSIDDLKALQRRLGLLDTHVVYLGAKQFVVAHTDAERASIDLETCELHSWLYRRDGPPAEIGYYTARPHEPDSRSETYMAEPWDLEPLPSLYTPTGVRP